MSNLPPTEQLLAFKTAVELESFTAAAARLSLTQSAISHQIRKLEKRLGTRLITRTSHGVALTDTGEFLYSSIAEPLARLLDAFDGYPSDAAQGHLRIFVEPLLSAAWFSPRLCGFLDRFQNLRLEQMRSATAFFSDRFELAIKWGSGHWPNCTAEFLMSLDYTPVCAPCFLDGNRPLRSPKDLHGLTLIHDRRYGDWQRWFSFAGLDSRKARDGHFADDTHIVIEMTKAGRGIALANALLIQRELTEGSLRLPFPTLRMPVKEAYYIVSRRGNKMSKYAEAFAEWIKEESRKDKFAILAPVADGT